MDHQSRQDFLRCLPAAQELYNELVSARMPIYYADAIRHAVQDTHAEDKWAAITLPRMLAEVSIAAHISNDNDLEFSYALDRIFGSKAQDLVSMPLEYASKIMQKTEKETADFLQGLGYRITDGAIIGHSPVTVTQNNADAAPKTKTTKGPRP